MSYGKFWRELIVREIWTNFDGFKIGHMRWRSNTRVYIATTGSKTRTRQSVIKTPFTCVVTPGRAQRYPATKPLFILRRLRRLKRARGLPMTPVDIAAKNFPISLSRIGTADSNI